MNECYTKAVAEPQGHLLIDLDPKKSERLRFCSNIVGPGPTIFYLPSSQAKITEITNEREKFAYTQSLGKTHFSSATKTVEKRWEKFFDILNVINGTVGINLKELRPHEKQLRRLCKKSTSVKERRKILLTSKGPKWKEGKYIKRKCFEVARYVNSGPETKTREILNKNEASDVFDFNETGELTVNKISTKIALSTCLHNLQQPNKSLSDPAYSLVLKEVQLNPGLVPNKNDRRFLNPLPETTKKTGTRKASSQTLWEASDDEFEENTKDETSSSKTRTTRWKRQRSLGKNVYTRSRCLSKCSKLDKSK